MHSWSSASGSVQPDLTSWLVYLSWTSCEAGLNFLFGMLSVEIYQQLDKKGEHGVRCIMHDNIMVFWWFWGLIIKRMLSLSRLKKTQWALFNSMQVSEWQKKKKKRNYNTATRILFSVHQHHFDIPVQTKPSTLIHSEAPRLTIKANMYKTVLT